MIIRTKYNDDLPTVEMDETADGTTYLRNSSDATCLIKKISTTGTRTKMEHAYGAWEDRATLAYVALDKEIEVEV